MPQAGYFVVADGAALGFTDGAELCRRLPELAGVVGVPVSAFCRAELADGCARSSGSRSASRPPVLAEAALRLAALGRR